MNFTEIRGRPCRIMWSQRDPSVRKSGVGNIFIKNLPPTVDHKNLYDLFSVFGNILSCKVSTDENAISKGYGYIHYETAEAAQEAITKFNGYTIDDHTVEVVSFLKRNERASQNLWTNTYMKQFPKSWDEERLKELVTPFGEVVSVVVQREADGSSKGFGFINFVEHESAAKAVEALNDKVIEEDNQQYTLYFGRAQKKNERQRELATLISQKREERINLYQGRNVYVKNIDDEVTDDELLKLFSEHGSVANCKIMRETNGTSKGFGFLCFNNSEDAQKSITALNGIRLRSKPLVVTLHQRKEIRRNILAQSASERWRFMQGGPGGNNMGNMPMPPYMFMQPGAQGSFPGQRQFYGDFPRGPNAPRNNGAAMPPAGVRGPYYQQVPGPFPPNQGPIGNGPMGQQMKRIPPPGGMPMPQGQAGVMGVPRGMPRGMPGNMQPGRGGPFPGGPGAPRGMPMQVPGQFPGNRGQVPVGIKFNNQVRNQPMDMSQGGMEPQGLGLPNQGMQEPLDHTVLASLDLGGQKNMLGERLYPLVMQHEPKRAGKITGMLLEMEITELINLVESPEALVNKIREAVMVLEQHERSLANQ